jgi:predicted amino acid dehydrogenase
MGLQPVAASQFHGNMAHGAPSQTLYLSLDVWAAEALAGVIDTGRIESKTGTIMRPMLW